MKNIAYSCQVFIKQFCVFDGAGAYGCSQKKGKAPQGRLGEIGIEGNENRLKNLVILSDLPAEDISDWDPAAQSFTLKLPTFSKNEVAVSRTLLKIGLEALFTSKRKIYLKYDFTELRKFLDNTNATEWPLVVSGKILGQFESIPINIYKHHLAKFSCTILYQETDENTLLFRFSYGGVPMIINLLNRNIGWLEFQEGTTVYETIYPAHYRKKLLKYLEERDKNVGYGSLPYNAF